MKIFNVAAFVSQQARVVIVTAILSVSGAAWAGYGAIAYSPSTGEVGYSDGYNNQIAATDGALNACGYTDCESINWEFNSCNAFASSPSGAWGEAHGYADSNSAVNAALSVCGADCSWRAWVCN